METLLWIVLGVLLVVGEIFTTTLFLVMFGVGAFAAAGAAALGAPFGVQALVFALVSALTLLVARPTIQRHRQAATESGPDAFGVRAIEGSTAVVLERVTPDSGRVKIGGELWFARSYDASQVLEPGERVRVVEVRGVTAMVWRDEISTEPPADSAE